MNIILQKKTNTPHPPFAKLPRISPQKQRCFNELEKSFSRAFQSLCAPGCLFNCFNFANLFSQRATGCCHAELCLERLKIVGVLRDNGFPSTFFLLFEREITVNWRRRAGSREENRNLREINRKPERQDYIFREGWVGFTVPWFLKTFKCRALIGTRGWENNAFRLSLSLL